MATLWSGRLDHGAQHLRSMGPEAQILAMHGQPELSCRRLNYLTHACFLNSFDDNRFFTPMEWLRTCPQRIIEPPGPNPPGQPA